MRNSKSEILNSKQYQNSNVLNSKLSWGLGIWISGIGICLGFSAWDLEFLIYRRYLRISKL